MCACASRRPPASPVVGKAAAGAKASVPLWSFRKILTFSLQRRRFGVHKWDFVAQKRRFKIPKRRFCFAVFEI